MLNYVLQAEDVVRGAFPKISLEILFINLYNLSRLREVEHVLSGMAYPSTQREDESQSVPVLDARTETRTENSTEAGAEAKPEQPGAGDAIQAEAAAAVGQHAERNPKVQEFLDYLKTESPFINSVLQSLEVDVKDGKLVILLDKKYGFIRQDNSIISEVKKQAAQFFGKEVGLQFSDANGPKEDTLEDYVKEAESLFNV